MKWTTRVLAACAAVLFAVALSCAKQAATQDRAAEDAGAAVDIQVMAFLSQARALHHEANIKEDDGDVAGAIAAMNRLVVAQRPHPDEQVPEVEEVLADAWARMAELELKAHDLNAAEKAVNDGLEHAREATYFRGHLLEVQGVIEEARANDYADAGNKEAAQKAKARAIDLLHQAVVVQEAVIGRALDGGAAK